MTRREEIEQAAMQVGGVHPDWDALECFRVGYKEGAKMADKTMIEKACKWMEENLRAVHPRTGKEVCIVNLNSFREAMEE